MHLKHLKKAVIGNSIASICAQNNIYSLFIPINMHMNILKALIAMASVCHGAVINVEEREYMPTPERLQLHTLSFDALISSQGDGNGIRARKMGTPPKFTRFYRPIYTPVLL